VAEAIAMLLAIETVHGNKRHIPEYRSRLCRAACCNR
jgi:hypothetical protein